MMKILRFIFTARQTLQVAWRLLWDPKVPSGLKLLLPVLAIIYLISPLDLMPFLPFDDIVVVGLAMKLFVELARPNSTDYSDASGNSSDPNAEAINTTWRVVEDEVADDR